MRPIPAVFLMLLMLAAAPVEARNRINEVFKADFRNKSGYSQSTIDRYIAWHESEDKQHLPGIFLSQGGYSTSYGGRARSLATLALFNESATAICVRADAKMTMGDLINSRRGGNLGSDLLVEPGQYVNILAHTDTFYAKGITRFAYRTYYWLPEPASVGKRQRCADKPYGFEDYFSAPVTSGGKFKAHWELERALGVR